MWRVLALLVTICSVAFARNDSVDPDSFDIEPPLLIPNRDREREREAETKSPNGPTAGLDVTKLEKQLERAKRNVAGLDRLLRIGALSKVEVEQRKLRVVHLESDLANAQLIAAKQQMLQKDQQLSTGEVAKSEVTPVENSLALAIEAAHSATLKRYQADINAAEANVHRQEKLVALGSARKSDVLRAEKKLAEVTAQKN